MRTALAIAFIAFTPAWARAASTADLVAALANHDSAADALEQLVAQGAAAVPSLSAVAKDGHDLTQRGWAIVGLRRIGGQPAARVMVALLDDPHQPVLVRTWAAAARVDLAADFDSVLALAPLIRTYPSVRRPLLKRVEALGSGGQPVSLVRLLEVASQDVELQSALAPLVQAAPMKDLVHEMLRGKSQQTRMLAAGYLASRGQGAGASDVATDIVQSISFQPGAAEPPWAGGPLYIPSIAWSAGAARQLFGELVRWHVWGDLRGKRDVQGQVDQSLNSVGLAGQAGYQPSWGSTSTAHWLQEYGRISGGGEAVRRLLAEQGAAAEPRYQSTLGGLK